MIKKYKQIAVIFCCYSRRITGTLKVGRVKNNAQRPWEPGYNLQWRQVKSAFSAMDHQWRAWNWYSRHDHDLIQCPQKIWSFGGSRYSNPWLQKLKQNSQVPFLYGFRRVSSAVPFPSSLCLPHIPFLPQPLYLLLLLPHPQIWKLPLGSGLL